MSRAVSLRPLAWFGRNMSYSLYLWHVVVLDLVLMAFSGPLARIIAIAGALLAAGLSHFLIERPFGRLKERWEPKRAASRADGRPSPHWTLARRAPQHAQLKSASGALP